MGEYATRRDTGEEVKIGTCESMYYLRADHAGDVIALPGNVDPLADAVELRFRFPFPDEDRTAPGEFTGDYRRTYRVDLAEPIPFEHYTLQFSAPNGYLVSLPCPEGLPDYTLPEGIKVHRNGYGGSIGITAQGWRGHGLAVILRCHGCGAMASLPTLADVEPVIVALRASVDRMERDLELAKLHHGPDLTDPNIEYAREMARRVLAGYDYDLATFQATGKLVAGGAA